MGDKNRNEREFPIIEQPGCKSKSRIREYFSASFHKYMAILRWPYLNGLPAYTDKVSTLSTTLILRNI